MRGQRVTVGAHIFTWHVWNPPRSPSGLTRPQKDSPLTPWGLRDQVLPHPTQAVVEEPFEWGGDQKTRTEFGKL